MGCVSRPISILYTPQNGMKKKQPGDPQFQKYIGMVKTEKRLPHRYVVPDTATKTQTASKKNVTTTDEDVLQQFEIYLTTVRRTKKKNARQYVQEVRRMPKLIGKKSIRCFFTNTDNLSSAKEALQAIQEPTVLSAASVRHYLGSFKRLVDFMTLKKHLMRAMNITHGNLTEAARVCDAVNKELSGAVADQQVRKLEEYDGSYSISVQDEQRYRTKAEEEVKRIEAKMHKGQLLTSQERHYFSQFVMLDIAMTNAGRTGVISNSTVTEFGDIKMEKGMHAFKVKTHKTRSTYGSAPVVLSDCTYQRVLLYQAHVRPHLHPQDTYKDRLFLNNNGGPVKPSDSFPRHWLTVTGEKRKFTPTMVRHRDGTLSAQYAESFADRTQIADFMAHTVETQNKYYKAHIKLGNAVDAFNKLGQYREQEKRALAVASDNEEINQRKDRALKSTATLRLTKLSLENSESAAAQELPPSTSIVAEEKPFKLQEAKLSKLKSRSKFRRALPLIMAEFGAEINNGYVDKRQVINWWKKKDSIFSGQQIYDFIRQSLLKKGADSKK